MSDSMLWYLWVFLFFGVNLKVYLKISDLQQKIRTSLPLASVNAVPIKTSRSSVRHLSSCLWEILSSQVFTCIIYPNRGRIHRFRSSLLCMTVPVYSNPSGFVSQHFHSATGSAVCMVNAPCAWLRVLCHHVCLPVPKPLRPSPGRRESSPGKAWQSPSVWKWLRWQR